MSDSRLKLFQVSNGLLEGHHREAMGAAVWEYLVLLDWQTSGDGKVKHGRPIKLEDIAHRLGRSYDATRANFRRLIEAGYIVAKRSPYGFIISITKPKKRFAGVGKNSQSRVGENAKSQRVETGSFQVPEWEKTPETNITLKRVLRGRDADASAPLDCSHSPRCKNPVWHVAVLVAEAQGLAAEAVGSRWLKGAKRLECFTDAEVSGCVAWMLDRDGGKWAERVLFPEFVAQDIHVFKRGGGPGRANGGDNLTEAELIARLERAQR